MKLQQLRVLIAIAEHGSLSMAAQSLHITQPAVTKAIQELETDLGVSLVVRSSQGAKLSMFGQILVKHARIVDQEIRHAKEDIASLSGLKKGNVFLGVTPVVALGPISKAISAFNHRYPDINIHINEMRPAQITEGLLDGTLDLGVISRIGIPNSPRYHWETLYKINLLVCLRINSQLPEVTSIMELAGYTWLVWDKLESPGSMFAEIFSAGNVKLPKKIIRCSSTVLYSQLAAQQDYACVITEPAFEWSAFKGKLKMLNLEEQLPVMHAGLVYRKESLLTDIVIEFSELIRAICKDPNDVAGYRCIK
ncbi:LysR family transcriptional regulator [Glaciimonas sp. Gout2]|uniref:LysR family transcriptional regulator n=1 Tax=unclassified Glaciimonas TaxID=2644401 RepID=UPI002B23D765|nr:MULTISPECIES: LysR family transcriptional regulator [unclassified Glaciimonas]MEB0014295.1 LysR family transcriptional regulator [Glaciimonas sp. Cout2]MEB0084410.1 LysR family transcriptional regulator [Glaciimonas sp. Gout2]